MRRIRTAAGAFFGAVSAIILESIFPTPPAEREVLAMNGPAAFRTLPRAPQSRTPEACSVFAYKDERVSRLIWSIKYKKSRAGAAIAAYGLHRMARCFALGVPPGMRVLIAAMPVTKARRRERGFNQCELIMEEMRKLDAAWPEETGGRRLIFSSTLLMRVRHTSRQTMKDRAGRLESAADLFAVNEKAAGRLRAAADAAGMKSSDFFVVVIDDVVTTGSTIKDAICTLRRAGFENAWGLSIAH